MSSQSIRSIVRRKKVVPREHLVLLKGGCFFNGKLVISNGVRNLKIYYVYILASKTGTLYIGITNDLKRRIYEHKNKMIKGFTKKYNIDRLISLRRSRIEMTKVTKG